MDIKPGYHGLKAQFHEAALAEALKKSEAAFEKNRTIDLYTEDGMDEGERGVAESSFWVDMAAFHLLQSKRLRHLDQHGEASLSLERV